MGVGAVVLLVVVLGYLPKGQYRAATTKLQHDTATGSTNTSFVFVAQLLPFATPCRRRPQHRVHGTHIACRAQGRGHGIQDSGIWNNIATSMYDEACLCPSRPASIRIPISCLYLYIYGTPPQNLPFDEEVSIYLSYIYIYTYIRIYVEYNVYAYPLCGILPFQTNFISI